MSDRSLPRLGLGLVFLAGVLALDPLRAAAARGPLAAETLLSRNRPTLSSSNESSSLTPDKAVDGSTTTRWGSKEGVDPQWIQVDLGAAASLTHVRLNWEPA